MKINGTPLGFWKFNNSPIFYNWCNPVGVVVYRGAVPSIVISIASEGSPDQIVKYFKMEVSGEQKT